jgi:hypothetical protein
MKSRKPVSAKAGEPKQSRKNVSFVAQPAPAAAGLLHPIPATNGKIRGF